MRIGILFCAYNCEETVHESLNGWLQAKESKLDGNEYIISAVSVPFKEYKDINQNPDNTQYVLGEYVQSNKVDYLVSSPEFISESEARNLALEPLLTENLDLVILFDGDEIITTSQISNIINFIRLDPWCSWFSFSYKNYVFDTNTYLVDPFTPPRAFRVKTNGYILSSFNWDNDTVYKNILNSEYIFFKRLPTKVIPTSVAWIKHLTWLNNEKTKNKIAYQLNHFNGVCSYGWDREKDCLEFNMDFYSKNNIPLPITAKDS
jgi:hypothetical protein